MHSTVSVFSCSMQVKCFIFSVATNFNVFSLSQKFKDWGALGIQVYVKCQGLFTFNAN